MAENAQVMEIKLRRVAVTNSGLRNLSMPCPIYLSKNQIMILRFVH